MLNWKNFSKSKFPKKERSTRKMIRSFISLPKYAKDSYTAKQLKERQCDYPCILTIKSYPDVGKPGDIECKSRFS